MIICSDAFWESFLRAEARSLVPPDGGPYCPDCGCEDEPRAGCEGCECHHERVDFDRGEEDNV